ncbi:hypothetical protein QAD02_018136 [Eretmocerus hayati]|uniref:Uncharacterized protein n=1 Tax=Eretmocerus hayati TaxID=131215 RepID=A0ACC2PFI2_9HYME|nr:hypothetical protein QAD02_018136 [Eretmocerus hayati]
MESKLINFIIILLTVTNWRTTWANIDEVMNHLFSYIEHDLSPHKVNIIVPSIQRMSSLAEKIVRRANQDSTCDIRDFNKTSLIKYANLSAEKKEEYEIRQISERLSLTFAIVEAKNKTGLNLELFAMLKYFNLLSPLTRGKYLLNLITDQEINLELFLRNAWSQKFLDLTVVEWITTDRSDAAKAESVLSLVRGAFVHSFNPFNNSFDKVVLNEETDLFPDKIKDLHGFPLKLWGDSDGLDAAFLESLLRSMNSEKRCVSSLQKHKQANGETYFYSQVTDLTISDYKYASFYVSTPVTLGYFHKQQLFRSLLPSSYRVHFYLMREKSYEKRISLAAILTFAGLAFTAFLFASWAQLLGFREANWSFLNIFTAQMGSSIAFTGQMRLSKVIFQMSIYIATFIIVTLGSDYMFQIFTLHQELPEIKTMKDLANSDIDLVMWDFEYSITRKNYESLIDNDLILRKILDSVQTQELATGFNRFCSALSYMAPNLDESVNLCIEDEINEHYVSKSNSRFQVDKIQDPIAHKIHMIELEHNTFFKRRLDELILKFSEAGLIEIWQSRRKNLDMRQASRYGVRLPKGVPDEEEPLENQLWPVLVVGYILGCSVLIGELIWKIFIARTELGRLMSAFYRNLQGPSADMANVTRHRMDSTKIKIQVRNKETPSRR